MRFNWLQQVVDPRYRGDQWFAGTAQTKSRVYFHLA